MAEDNEELLTASEGESEAEHSHTESHTEPLSTPNTAMPMLNIDLKHRAVDYSNLPLGMWVLEKAGLLNFKPLIRCVYCNLQLKELIKFLLYFSHKAIILILTFMCYTGLRISRKSFSVVKVIYCTYSPL